ncbi:hypothetical protein [Metabacillus fastidiosus]|uniref:DUF3221 domain-containing protein n=1 Tax=Metabacillus fastidiosus TaxID=1458 RepID=A0ABU6NS44_9BACI|nr:hypothetical protein [Metabacillus fastidiosus]MED4399966.1 hypothetical protein [Metabacillus fastidiosus]MED4462451.1 hypothetical protein [Metabacillus fastidiosus]
MKDKFLLIFILVIGLSYLNIKHNEAERISQAAQIAEESDLNVYEIVSIEGTKVIAQGVNQEKSITFDTENVQLKGSINVGSTVKVFMEADGQLQGIKYIEVLKR